ncbi:MAG: hypothetical protein R3C45_00450 [Phycisphaerales bacterium]
MKPGHMLCIWCVPALSCLAHAEKPQDIPIAQLGTQYRLTGKLHAPLGEVITVEGVLVEGPFKGNEGGPNLRVQRIQGSAMQEDIQISVTPFFAEWGEEIEGSTAYGSLGEGIKLSKIEEGKAYQMTGYTTGWYVGVPNDVMKHTGVAIQTAGHYFHETFVVYRAKVIEPLSFGPNDFTGRIALLAGLAVSENGRSVMQGDGWSVLVDEASPWPNDIEGKTVETQGMYNPTGDRHVFTLVDGDWRLVRLEDQLNKKVALRGIALRHNGVWHLLYRGEEVYVENMQDLPGWTRDNHLRPVIIRGILDRATLPRLDQVSMKRDRDLTEYYIVREPSWEPLGALLAPECPMPDEATDNRETE